jgi:hypothetical protein
MKQISFDPSDDRASVVDVGLSQAPLKADRPDCGRSWSATSINLCADIWTSAAKYQRDLAHSGTNQSKILLITPSLEIIPEDNLQD